MIDPFQKKLLEKPLTYQEAIAKMLYNVLRSKNTILLNYEHIFFGGAPKGAENKFVGSVIHSISKVRIESITYPKMEEGVINIKIVFQRGFMLIPIGRITGLVMYLYLEGREEEPLPRPIDLIVTYGAFRKTATAITLREKLSEVTFKISGADAFIPKLKKLTREYPQVEIIE